ncbi:hypothetical protein [Streptacidiphilus sp. P02-A3a]|uniref:hypothetical protein n=1 Tax=Streptacidiphilus sp. P02-A3a TaxID=2704468 RepID=UPI0015F8EE1E|nr:hypothetical protein [Streptacidiphilus sp. P02-A3a]QMU70628.1 hypothetical protein GXP74_22920 [Streptacidiphilus sp. P02-A3a]
MMTKRGRGTVVAWIAILCTVGAVGCGASQSAGATGGAGTGRSGIITDGPSFLPANELPPGGPALPLIAAAPKGAASLPWQLVSQDRVHQELTIEVARGGCTAVVPEGFTESATATAVTVSVVAEVYKASACGADLSFGLYTVKLTAADASLGIEHGAIHDWESGS